MRFLIQSEGGFSARKPDTDRKLEPLHLPKLHPEGLDTTHYIGEFETLEELMTWVESLDREWPVIHIFTNYWTE